jgi:hypothetical protein
MRIGFTGTRLGMTDKQKEVIGEALEWALEITEVHHGVCVGADEEFHSLAVELGIPIVGHPPSEVVYLAKIPDEEFEHSFRPKKYLVRNREMVDVCDMIYAAPKEYAEVLRSGTWATVRYTIAKEKPVGIVFPNGELKVMSKESLTKWKALEK